MKDILILKDLHLTYHTKKAEVEALKGLNLTVKEQEFVAIVGPSGCGKTSILSLISGLIKPTKGEIIFNLEESENRLSKIGYMFQKDHLFDWLTVWKNILIGPEIQGKYLNKQELVNLENLLKKYEIYDFKNYYPRQLSGGMRQRVALIRTLALNPEILLLDEAFSALDYQTRLNVCDDVYRIIKQEKKTVVLVTHDIAEAISMADRVVVLTKRPAKVKKIFDINLKEFPTPLKRRDSKDFRVLFDKIWKELQYE